jgi:diguanylate cyclase (GGDEF)-like protein/PAS domain S-box-containing protein
MARPASWANAVADAKAIGEFGPLAAPGRLRRLAPFVVVAMGVLIAGALDRLTNAGVVAVLSALSALFMVAAAALPWRRFPRFVQGGLIVVPLFLIDGMMRADGGLDSHILVVLLVPLIWLALYESRRVLFFGIICAAALLGAESARGPSLDDVLRALMVILVAFALLPPIRRLVASNRAAMAALAAAADMDALTGLWNRRGLEFGLREPERDLALGFGMIFVDLDDFKDVNDAYGHDSGDQLLVQVGRRLTAVTRSGDLVARIGGDEFVLATHTDRAGVETLADRAQAAISNEPFDVGGALLTVSASVGFSHTRGGTDSAARCAELLDQADRAMYLAKAVRDMSSPASVVDVPRRPARSPVTNETRTSGSCDARDALAERSGRAASLMEYCADPIFVIDASGIVVETNPATDALVGATTGRSAVAVLREIAHPDDLDAVLHALEADTAEGGVHPPVLLRIADGAGRWIHLSAVANNRLSDPDVRGIVVNAHDVTAEMTQLTRTERSEEGLIAALIRTGEVRDPSAAGHQRKVAEWSVRIGRQLALSDHAIRDLRLGASVHDIGKIAVPSEILTRPCSPSDPERAIVETHCRAGEQVLSGTGLPAAVIDIVLHHHERLDGSGYPDRLVRDELSMSTRIVAVADVFDAMTSRLPYRPGLGLEAALDELATNAGRLYCPDVVAAVLALTPELV